MDVRFTYLLINAASISIPLLFSFHPKLKFSAEWKATWLAIIAVAIPFIIWDVFYTDWGVWGFNETYLLGISILGLPLEEILFFICIPYACLFTYHCLKTLYPSFFIVNINYVTIGLMLCCTFFGVYFIDNLYTGVTFIALGFTLGFILFFFHPTWLPRLYTSLLLLIIPFTIVNGLLTGTGLTTEVVWYNEQEMMGYRFLSIPFEDFAYGTLLIVLNVFVYETYQKNRLASTT